VGGSLRLTIARDHGDAHGVDRGQHHRRLVVVRPGPPRAVPFRFFTTGGLSLCGGNSPNGAQVKRYRLRELQSQRKPDPFAATVRR
jgi:hypothetical protein